LDEAEEADGQLLLTSGVLALADEMGKWFGIRLKYLNPNDPAATLIT
jgi:hypothetical protein